MSRVRDFILEGDALWIEAHTGYDGRPYYTVEIRTEFDGKLSFQQMSALADALYKDVCTYDGVLHKYKEDRFTCDLIQEFQRDNAMTEGGEEDGIFLCAEDEGRM